ncbi:hypothetical protein BO83DRAFT_445733 [Aspergillus eucalypticola CBS 122712]|uniref:Xylanolytic transcriptional activator regulatory domain-containing protein n=1 Tax=Aspergillus eucalypticola (strain CBS 122712 / IBT 29274) TaxID=1448314 RepID=A0A317VL70_ASPEC|nr:uncharacterized protein BO83DRAFT_445733 [Aspergillus eucalypticola CBS 122712]PWY72650.1 hypothetical protein BO83DRAFT_445733 [Aspergillus eucalypticola CBS 122712]
MTAGCDPDPEYSVMGRSPFAKSAKEKIANVDTHIILRSESWPPTKCYIHALHSRIAFLEHQLAAAHNGAEQDRFLTVGLGSDEEFLKTPSLQPASHSFSGFRREFRISGAYGLFYSRELGEQQQSSSGVDILENVESVSEELFLLSPDAQSQLLDDFWTWRNTWPVLVHEPLFHKDLTNGGVKVYATPTLSAAMLAFSSQYASDAQLSVWRTSGEALAKHAKSKILAQIEYPCLVIVLAAAIIALRELAVDNLSSASQYIGIAFRHSLTLGLHVETPTIDGSIQGSQEVLEARSLAWWGVWLLERHISQILGQPSALRDGDMRPGPVPILPSVEYRLWSVSDTSDPGLAFSSMSNLQYACQLVRMVSPVLDEIHALESPLSILEKEEKATKTHVDMSEFYNTLPSHLRLPATATKQLSPPVYQFKYTILGNHDEGNFYPLGTLSPFAVHSLATSSLVHLLNADSADATLSQRTTHLYRLNLRFLGQMSSTNYVSNRAIKALTSLECEGDASIQPNTTKPSVRDRPADGNSSVSAGQRGAPTTALEPMNIFGHIDSMEDASNWFQLPLNEQLVFDDVIESTLWEDVCESHDPMGGLPPLHGNL